jgi:hypothetical protein
MQNTEALEWDFQLHRKSLKTIRVTSGPKVTQVKALRSMYSCQLNKAYFHRKRAASEII